MERAGLGRLLAGKWVVFEGLRVDLNGDNGEKQWLFAGSFCIIASWSRHSTVWSRVIDGVDCDDITITRSSNRPGRPRSGEDSVEPVKAQASSGHNLFYTTTVFPP